MLFRCYFIFPDVSRFFPMFPDSLFCRWLLLFAGDFAVLLQAGMSVKQALVYNCVSSVLCFLGMIFGVALGNVGEASLWIFACIAGTFLYIALVDMVRVAYYSVCTNNMLLKTKNV